jgi:hypothetical protein
MAKPTSSGLRSRTMSAALVTLGCSLGVTLTPAMLAADKKAPADQIESRQHKLDANQMKERASLEKAVAESKAALEADQWKLNDFQKSLKPADLKLEANQIKIGSLKATLERSAVKLKASQEKLAAASRK